MRGVRSNGYSAPEELRKREPQSRGNVAPMKSASPWCSNCSSEQENPEIRRGSRSQRKGVEHANRWRR